jgi:hypothetical protein
MTAPTAGELATTEEVAAYLRKSPAALRQLRYEGKAPRAAKVGPRLLWHWADVHRWLEEKTSETPRRGQAA